jgi:hypothetical protein
MWNSISAVYTNIKYERGVHFCHLTVKIITWMEVK